MDLQRLRDELTERCSGMTAEVADEAVAAVSRLCDGDLGHMRACLDRFAAAWDEDTDVGPYEAFYQDESRS